MDVDETSGTPAGEVRADPKDIDGPWLTDALEAAGVARGAQVLEVVSGGSIGTGQAASSARLHLTWSDPEGRPATLVGKFPSGDEMARGSLRASGGYHKEWVFYDQLAATVGVQVPTCHVARIVPETQDFVLLMEDLAGARAGDQIKGLTADEVALAVGQAVELHAPHTGNGSLVATLAAGEPTTMAEAGEFARAIYEVAMVGFLDRNGGRLTDDVVDLVQRLAPTVARWFAGTDSPSTLIHMDYRADNFLFGSTPNDPEITIVDFQTLAYGNGAIDLAYAIGGSFPDPADRTAVERDLVDEYRSRMAAAGVDLSADVLWHDYRFGTVWSVLMAVMASMGAERSDRGDDMFVAMAERCGRQAIDLDALALLE
ncbi:phosphotransferase [Aquihabitans sp. McL0605]|uniref:phosphotransferase n=1 Tax=Aquihabitans sp. McL0605 TaxID=3415671 RepID=UPI003CF685D0